MRAPDTEDRRLSIITPTLFVMVKAAQTVDDPHSYQWGWKHWSMFKLWETQFLIKRINEIYNPLGWSEVHDTHLSLLLKPQKAFKANSHTYQWKCSSSSISIWPRKKKKSVYLSLRTLVCSDLKLGNTHKKPCATLYFKGYFPINPRILRDSVKLSVLQCRWYMMLHRHWTDVSFTETPLA